MDDFHINNTSGTSLFMADMYHGLRRNTPLSHTRDNRAMEFRSSRYAEGHQRDMGFGSSRYTEKHPREQEYRNMRVPERHSSDVDMYSRNMTASRETDMMNPHMDSHPTPRQDTDGMDKLVRLMTLSLMKNLKY